MSQAPWVPHWARSARKSTTSTEPLPLAQSDGQGGGVNTIVSTGRRPGVSSRLPKRRDVFSAASLPRSSHPKLLEGLSSQNWTSATSSGVDAQVAVVGAVPTSTEALVSAAKSPPGFAQKVVGKKVWIHVASPGVEGAPCPPGKNDVPSPQSASTRCSSTAWGF